MTSLNPALANLPPVLKTTVPGPAGEPVKVYRFGDGVLQKQIDDVLNRIDKGNVVLKVGAGSIQRTVTAVLALRTNGDGPWTLATGFAATLDGEWEGRVEVVKVF